MVFVYGLIDPRSGKLFYVGSTKDLGERWYMHISEMRSAMKAPSQNDKCVVIRGLLDAGLYPDIRVLELTNEENRKNRETYWLRRFVSSGVLLTNRHKHNA